MLTPDQEKLKEAALELQAAYKNHAYFDAEIVFEALANPAAILAILAQLEQVQGDADRLDFAQSTVIDGQADTWRIDIDHYNGMTLRAALDAARTLPPPPEAA